MLKTNVIRHRKKFRDQTRVSFVIGKNTLESGIGMLLDFLRERQVTFGAEKTFTEAFMRFEAQLIKMKKCDFFQLD